MTTVVRLLPAEEVLREFGKTISYAEIKRVLPQYSYSEQKRISEGVRKRQQEFWEETTNYYVKVHPELPPISKHFELLLGAINARRGQIIVDLGCGAGALIERLLKQEVGIRIIGIDYVSEMAEQCRRKFGDNEWVTLNISDITKGLSLADGKIDTCVSNWGISYSDKEDLREVILPEIRRVLKPQGRFICTAMITGGELATLERFLDIIEAFRKRKAIGEAKRFAEKLEKFFPMYTVEEWEEMLVKSKFIIEKSFLSIYGTSLALVARPAV